MDLVRSTSRFFGPERMLVIDNLVIGKAISVYDYEDAARNPEEWINVPPFGSGYSYAELLARGMSHVSTAIEAGRFTYLDPA